MKLAAYCLNFHPAVDSSMEYEMADKAPLLLHNSLLIVKLSFTFFFVDKFLNRSQNGLVSPYVTLTLALVNMEYSVYKSKVR